MFASQNICATTRQRNGNEIVVTSYGTREPGWIGEQLESLGIIAT